MLEFDGLKLKELRKARKLKQRELGLLVGKRSGHIANYENGVAAPPSDVLLSLLEFFQVSVKEMSRPAQSLPQ